MSASRIYTVFPDRLFVSIPEAARALGISQKTIRNALYVGTFPVPTVKLGRRRLISVDGLAAFYERVSEPGAQHVVIDEPQRPPPRRRGRPRKTAAEGGVA